MMLDEARRSGITSSRPTFAMAAGRRGYKSWWGTLMLTVCCNKLD
jgi:hypothetical protein